MSQALLDEVFTAEEVARAAGVGVREVQALIASGEIHAIPGTSYVPARDAFRAGRRLLAETLAQRISAPSLFSAAAGRSVAERRAGLPAIASSAFHAVLIAVVLWFSAGTDTAAVDEALPTPTRLVFIMSPGPGGGGGGGGLRNPLPPRKVQRRGPPRPRVSVPEVTPTPVVTARQEETPKDPTPIVAPTPAPIERKPDPTPTPSPVVVAPVVAAAPDPRDSEGVITKGRDSASQGPGGGGGAGTGQGTGNGEGAGSGIDDGAGGGIGGGPYRPGSGIDAPRLLREVKAEYTDDARRRGLTGDVVLEIVVRRDGSVGEVSVVRGLDPGLDQRAVAAVRQWRFAPARRKGSPVDVIVEVAVEFTLR